MLISQRKFLVICDDDVLRAFLHDGIGLLLVLAADLLPPVVDDQEPRRRAALCQAAPAIEKVFQNVT